MEDGVRGVPLAKVAWWWWERSRFSWWGDSEGPPCLASTWP